MDKNKHIQEELNELSPFLGDKLKESKGGFKVPDGYFGSLSDRIMDNLEKEDTSAKVVGIDSQTIKSIPAKRSPLRFVAAAASIALVVVAGFWMMGTNDTSNPYAKLEQLNEEGVLDFLDENMDDLDLTDLVEVGLITDLDVDFKDVSQFSDEDTDTYINAILDEDLEEI